MSNLKVLIEIGSDEIGNRSTQSRLESLRPRRLPWGLADSHGLVEADHDQMIANGQLSMDHAAELTLA